MTTNGTRMMMRTSSHASTRELTMTNAEWLEDFAADWDSEVSKHTSERLMSSAAELRAAAALADACRNSGDERIQAALQTYLKCKGE